MAPTAGGTYVTDTGGRSDAAPLVSYAHGSRTHARSTDLFSRGVSSIYLEINYRPGLGGGSLSAVVSGRGERGVRRAEGGGNRRCVSRDGDLSRVGHLFGSDARTVPLLLASWKMHEPRPVDRWRWWPTARGVGEASKPNRWGERETINGGEVAVGCFWLV